MRVKGPFFKSFEEPPEPVFLRNIKDLKTPNRALPEGKSWLSHTGQKERIRNLRRICAVTLKSNDLEVIKAVNRVRETLKDIPKQELAVLWMISQAQQATDGLGISIDIAINNLMDRWDVMNKKEEK